MKTDDVSEFWLEKEQEAGSKLVIPTFAIYVQGLPDIVGPVSGLLYLMENGFYFENFEQQNIWSSLFQKSSLSKKSRFKKILLKIPTEAIKEVSHFLNFELEIDTVLHKRRTDYRHLHFVELLNRIQQLRRAI